MMPVSFLDIIFTQQGCAKPQKRGADATLTHNRSVSSDAAAVNTTDYIYGSVDYLR